MSTWKREKDYRGRLIERNEPIWDERAQEKEKRNRASLEKEITSGGIKPFIG